MSECTHGDKYRGMLFTKNGCVACQLEQTGEEAKQARAERDAALAEVERLRGICLQIHDELVGISDHESIDKVLQILSEASDE